LRVEGGEIRIWGVELRVEGVGCRGVLPRLARSAVRLQHRLDRVHELQGRFSVH